VPHWGDDTTANASEAYDERIARFSCRVKSGSFSTSRGWLNTAAGLRSWSSSIQGHACDPAKVVRTALQDAASVASLLITTEALVAEKPKKETPSLPAGSMSGMDY
jgi:hypothetical protein